MGDNAMSSNSNPSGVQEACPIGWHLPSDNEWKQLEMHLGMSQSEVDRFSWHGTNQGSQLAGNSSLWNSGDLVNNEQFGTSGFLGLPGGYRDYEDGLFNLMSTNGYWWSSIEYPISYALIRTLVYTTSERRVATTINLGVFRYGVSRIQINIQLNYLS